MSVLIIAEAGVNHNGSVDAAMRLCDTAKSAGADVVKFQTFKTERLLTKDTAMAEYQQANVGAVKTQFQMVKELELEFAAFRRIKDHCDSIGIQFLSTPDDVESLDFLVDGLRVGTIKVGSGEVTNLPFLRSIGAKKLPVILSTGMATLGEVERAILELERSGASKITLLHCTSNYPCPMGEVNLRAMATLRAAFGRDVGYSDHTRGITVPIAAVALGACVVEKHFTLDKSLPGPDHKASLDPAELGAMVAGIRDIEAALGDGIKKPASSEAAVKAAVRRSIVAAAPIPKDAMFSAENLTTKRTGGSGLPAEMWDYVIGRAAPKDFAVDECILF